MEILLWVVGIHLVELIGFGVYLLINKNKRLERIILSQNQYVESISYITSQLNASLNKIDEATYVEADPQLEEVFEQLKELNSVLEEISGK